MKDARPECAYQVGVTPENIECAKCAKDPKCLQTIDQMPAEHRPHKPTSPDPKWRFFWRIGPRPAKSAFPEQNLEPVVPAAFPNGERPWTRGVPRCLPPSRRPRSSSPSARPRALVTARADAQRPHLLAPTGSNLERYDQIGTIFAGWHTDLNFLTIHGSHFLTLRLTTRQEDSSVVGCLSSGYRW